LCRIENVEPPAEFPFTSYTTPACLPWTFGSVGNLAATEILQAATTAAQRGFGIILRG
jgi:hypothetical protein